MNFVEHAHDSKSNTLDSSGGPLRLRMEAILVHQHIELTPSHAEHLCCDGPVISRRLQGAFDQLLLYRLQRRSNADDKLIFAVLDLVNFLGKIAERYPALLSRDDGPLDRVPKLPHVARPTIRLERGQRFGVEAVNILSVLLIEFLDEVGNKQIEVLKSFAQWRDRDPENVKAIVQVLSQFLVPRELGEAGG